MVYKFEMDTITANDLGVAIENSAKEEKSGTDPQSLNNFKEVLHGFVGEMPHMLQPALTKFNDNFYKGYADVLDQRADIGLILQKKATEAEQREVETVNWFMDTQPKVLIP